MKPNPTTTQNRPVRRRRALTNVGGRITTQGDASAARNLAHALDVEPPVQGESESADRAHVHGFHTYPARMHPVTASRLVNAFAPPGGTVLDPFCGSGTVLIEAMLAGRQAIGVDLNPFAVQLSVLKTQRYPADELERLIEAARSATAHADSRRKARAGATHRYGPKDVALFEPHVLLELDGLRAGLFKERNPRLRHALFFVLSALLVKLSRKRGDTSEVTAPKRIAAGYTSKLFFRKTQELTGRLRDFATLLPKPTPQVRVFEEDAAHLKSLRAASIDTVITSPPYVATYDYTTHHELRSRWLGLDATQFERFEFGARRSYQDLSPDEAHDLWAKELAILFAALSRVTRPGGAVVVLLADSAVRQTALRADAIVRDVTKSSPLRFVAQASQARPHFHTPTKAAFQRQVRAEHAILLERV